MFHLLSNDLVCGVLSRLCRSAVPGECGGGPGGAAAARGGSQAGPGERGARAGTHGCQRGEGNYTWRLHRDLFFLPLIITLILMSL